MSKEIIKKSKLEIAKHPEGLEGPGFFATKVDDVIGMARANSLWPLPFATSCCGIEFMATMGSHYDLARFGMERLSFSPRQADLLMVMGNHCKKNGTNTPSGIRTNGRTALGAKCRRLCEQWRYFRYLQRITGH